MLKRYAVKLYYDGKNFYGFQLQKDRRTIAGEIFSAFVRSKLIVKPENAFFQAASRTDRGVSALGQTIAFNTEEKFSLKRINAFLPPDMYAWAWVEVPLNFNPRREAEERTYVYVYPYRGENLEKMRKVAKILKKNLVFGSYMGGDGKVYPRTLKDLSLTLTGECILFSFTSKSFVRGLVRKLTNLLLKVGQEKFSLNQLNQNLNYENLKQKIPPAPAENLLLLEVKYGFKFNVDENSKKKLLDKFRGDLCLAQLKNICLRKLASI